MFEAFLTLLLPTKTSAKLMEMYNVYVRVHVYTCTCTCKTIECHVHVSAYIIGML